MAKSEDKDVPLDNTIYFIWFSTCLPDFCDYYIRIDPFSQRFEGGVGVPWYWVVGRVSIGNFDCYQ